MVLYSALYCTIKCNTDGSGLRIKASEASEYIKWDEGKRS